VNSFVEIVELLILLNGEEVLWVLKLYVML